MLFGSFQHLFTNPRHLSTSKTLLSTRESEREARIDGGQISLPESAGRRSTPAWPFNSQSLTGLELSKPCSSKPKPPAFLQQSYAEPCAEPPAGGLQALNH